MKRTNTGRAALSRANLNPYSTLRASTIPDGKKQASARACKAPVDFDEGPDDRIPVPPAHLSRRVDL